MQPTSSTSGRFRTSPSTPAGSLFLDYTRRTAVEAQAQRTSVRMMELEMAAKNEEMAERFQGGQPDDGSPSPAFSPPAYPGTAARQNVTERRSRNRLSTASSAATTPENITSRLSNRRTRDVRYSVQSDGDFRGATAVTYRKQHGREIQETHLRGRGVSPAVESGSSPNQMAGSVAFLNPNPVGIATNPNQRLRSNLKSDRP